MRGWRLCHCNVLSRYSSHTILLKSCAFCHLSTCKLQSDSLLSNRLNCVIVIEIFLMNVLFIGLFISLLFNVCKVYFLVNILSRCIIIVFLFLVPFQLSFVLLQLLSRFQWCGYVGVGLFIHRRLASQKKKTDLFIFNLYCLWSSFVKDTVSWQWNWL